VFIGQLSNYQLFRKNDAPRQRFIRYLYEIKSYTQILADTILFFYILQINDLKNIFIFKVGFHIKSQ